MSRITRMKSKTLVLTIIFVGCAGNSNWPTNGDQGTIQADNKQTTAVDGASSLPGDNASTSQNLPLHSQDMAVGGSNDLLVPDPENNLPIAKSETFICTQVIGFSQTGQWYSQMENEVDNSAFQVTVTPGSRIDKWTHADFEGWRARPKSPCSKGSKSPDRIIFCVSGNHGEDVNRWYSDTKKTVNLIKQTFPSAKRIILQSVVGADDENGKPCTNSRAARQRPFIDQGLQKVVAEKTSEDVELGLSPRGSDGRCDGVFADSTGHLTRKGLRYAGELIGKYYAARDAGDTPPRLPQQR